MKTNAIPLVRASAFCPLIKFLDQIGSPTEQLLRQAKLPLFALQDPEALIPLHQCWNFFERAAQLEGIDNLGILAGQQAEISELGVFGHLLCQSLTLFDLLTTLEKTINTYISIDQIWMTQEGDQAGMHHRYNNPPTPGSQQARLYTVVLYLKVFQLVLGRAWRPIAIHLQVSPSKSLINIEMFADAQIVFDQPSSAIIFPRSLLRSPFQQPATAHTSAYQSDYETLRSSAPSPDFSGSLKQLLRSLLRDGYPNIDWVAEVAGMSTRSLQRRLADNDLNYSHLVDQVRFEVAVHWLQNTDIKLVEIAHELGYTDAANFTRAFKRWTGISPRKFRDLHIEV